MDSANQPHEVGRRNVVESRTAMRKVSSLSLTQFSLSFFPTRWVSLWATPNHEVPHTRLSYE